MYIEGSFVQLFKEVNKPDELLPECWNENYWNSELSNMKKLGMNLIVIQYSAYNDFAYYNSKLFKDKSNINFIDIIIKNAQKLDMDVFLGLYTSDDWWSYCNNDKYLELEKNRSFNVFDELWLNYGQYSNLKGIYIPQELEDKSYRTKENRNRIKKFISDISDYCKKRDPKLKILIAPFWGGYQSLEEYLSWWLFFLKDISVDIVSLQDGVGCHKVRPDSDDLKNHYAVLRTACQKNGVELWADLEIFDQIHGEPIDNLKWDAISADIQRIKTQLSVESQFVSKIICFEYFHYMSPSNSKGGEKLFKDYYNFLLRKEQNYDGVS